MENTTTPMPSLMKAKIFKTWYFWLAVGIALVLLYQKYGKKVSPAKPGATAQTGVAGQPDTATIQTTVTTPAS